MKNSKREEIVSHSAKKLFNIVLDIQSYPEYIPWCTKMVVNEKKSDEIFAEIKQSVDSLNGQFSNPEQIKKFVILPRDLTVDDGELTPTLKIRRKQIRENWGSEIESLYEDA